MARAPSLKVYRDKRLEWRWRLMAANNRIVADSGEGYKTKAGALKAALRLTTLMHLAMKDLIDARS
jgi:uncharacterized protein YegP (UPF0339 family)